MHNRRGRGAALIMALFLVFMGTSTHAETRLLSQLIGTSSVDQQANTQANYPAQSFTSTTSATILSVAIADNGPEILRPNKPRQNLSSAGGLWPRLLDY